MCLMQLQECCRPYHVGTARLTTAVDCIKARQSALFLGLEPFLVASTHPDSSGWLGGVRDFLSKKVRGQGGDGEQEAGDNQLVGQVGACLIPWSSRRCWYVLSVCWRDVCGGVLCLPADLFQWSTRS
jgi:hypothetical protein